jgi:hypothetical protein
MFMKKFSWSSFFIGTGAGIVIGVLALGILVNYLISNAIAGTSVAGQPLGGAIAQIREGMARADEIKNETSVYGQVVSIGQGSLVLSVTQDGGTKQQFTFRYDNNTKFVSIANDAASSEVPLSSDSITPGEGLNVYTNEAIGSVANQYAVKVIKI